MTVLQILGTLVLGLAVTLVLEGAVMLPLLVRQKRKDAFGAFALVNVATNIALNLILLIAYAADASYCGTEMTFSFCLAALALEMYLAGARDGGRVHHAFVTGELPGREIQERKGEKWDDATDA